jgi:biopolymer transport protein ExbD
MSSHKSPDPWEEEEPLISRRRPMEQASFDITAMIDLVFMLNIFFLVTTVAAAMAEMDLPVVRHCVPTDATTAVVVLLVRGQQSDSTVYLSDRAEGEALDDPEEQVRRVRELVQEGSRNDKRILLLKAERSVKLRDIQRIGAIAKSVPGTELRLAVIEKE